MDIQVPYNPNARQAAFHACPAEEVVYGGAKGGGKSCALVMEALAYGLENPGATIYLFRETYDDLEANLIREWKEKVPRELYRYNESKHSGVLTNGSTVMFRYIGSADDARGYQGRSMDFIGVDELTKHTEEAIQTLLSCLRSPKGFPVRFRGTCNPGDIGHTWVKARYIDPTNHGSQVVRDPVTDNRIAFIPAKVYDNDVLMQNDPAYVKRLENLPPVLRAAYLEGNWDIFAGQYYGEWLRDIHVVRPFEIPENWRRFRSLDYGLDMTACYWWAVDPHGHEYVYRELYEPDLSLSQAAKRIIELTGDSEDIGYTVASPDLWNRRQDSGFSGQEIMAQAKLRGLTKADDRRVPGWRALREHLTPYEETVERIVGVQVVAEKRRVAKLRFFETCPNIIRTLPALIHDEHDPEDVADKPHEITHGPESIRYGIMSRPAPRAPRTPDRYDPVNRWTGR